MPIPIAYPSWEEVITTVTLRTSEDEATLSWPPLPRWVLWIGVLVPVLAASVKAITLSLIIRMMPALPGGTFAAHPWVAVVFIGWVAGIGLWTCSAIYNFLWIARFGKSPRIVLTVGNGEYSTANPGFRRMRYRRHSLETLASLEVKPVNDIFGRHRSFVLVLHPHKGFRKRFPFSTDQAELPAQIEAAFLHHLRNSRQPRALAQKDVA